MGGLTIWGGWAWMKQEREVARNDEDLCFPMGVALVAALLAGAAHSMVSGLIVAPLSQMLFVVVGGWAWGRFALYTRLGSAAVSNFSHILFCVLLVGSLGVVSSSLEDLSTIRERRLAFLESVQHNRISPRYWHQGFIGVRNPNLIERARRKR